MTCRFNYLADAERKEIFRSQLRQYIRLYAFLSQIITFQDPDLERLYLFARLLITMLSGRERLPLYVTENIDLESYRVEKLSSGRIRLDKDTGWLDPISDLEGAGANDPEKEALSKTMKHSPKKCAE